MFEHVTRPDSHEMFGLGPVLDERRLAELFIVRPDLADPPPESLCELEERLGSLASLQQCLKRLDRFSCQVAQVLALTGPEPTADEVVGLIGPDARPDEVHRALEDLRARGLIERSKDAIRIHPAIREQRAPAGLGPQATALLSLRSAEELLAIASNIEVTVGPSQPSHPQLVARVANGVTDPSRVRELIGEAPEDVLALAMRLAVGSPGISTSAGFRRVYTRTAPECSWRAPHLWLARHGLIIEQEWYSAVMPREVAMVLRGGRPFETLTAVRPPLFAMAVDASQVERSSASRAALLVGAVERLIQQWGARPARLLKKGAVGLRDFQRFSATSGLDAVDAHFVVELAANAGLVGADFASRSALPLSACDEWLDLDLEARWERLVRAWLEAPAYLGRTTHGSSGRPHSGPPSMRKDPRSFASNAGCALLRCSRRIPGPEWTKTRSSRASSGTHP